jgi:hypothetical protein
LTTAAIARGVAAPLACIRRTIGITLAAKAKREKLTRPVDAV